MRSPGRSVEPRLDGPGMGCVPMGEAPGSAAAGLLQAPETHIALPTRLPGGPVAGHAQTVCPATTRPGVPAAWSVSAGQCFRPMVLHMSLCTL